MKNLFSLTPLTHSLCIDMMLQRSLVCFRTTLTHFVLFKNHMNQWKICFRRPLSQNLSVYIWCFRWLWIVFGQHSHTLWLSKNIWINEKSVFVDPSHTFCLSRYDASEGFGLFSDNTHTLCGFLRIYVEGDKPWQSDFRRHLSHILCVVDPSGNQWIIIFHVRVPRSVVSWRHRAGFRGVGKSNRGSF